MHPQRDKSSNFEKKIFFLKKGPHGGIHGYTPFEAHFNDWVSCQIARKNSGKEAERQAHLNNIFSNRPSNLFAVGDKILLKAKTRQFQKFHPLNWPTYQEKVYTISSCDFSKWPALYKLHEAPSARNFYGFEMLKLDPSFTRISERQRRRKDEHNNRILVEDVTLSEKTRLRSGRVIDSGREKVTYKISRQGRTEFVDPSALRLYKGGLGQGILEYTSEFNPPSWKAQYKI